MPEENKATEKEKTPSIQQAQTTPTTETKQEDWLKPLLSAVGGMGGSYLLFIKPLQDKLNLLVDDIISLKQQAKELKRQNEALGKEVEELNRQNEHLQANVEKLQNVNTSNTLGNTMGYLPMKMSNRQNVFEMKRL